MFARWSQRTPHPIRWLAALHLATAAAVGLTYLFTDKVPYIFTWLLQSSSFGVDAILFCQFALACVTVLPATLLMGGVFPLTVRVATAGSTPSGTTSATPTRSTPWAPSSVRSWPGSWCCPGGLEKGIYAAALFDLALAALLFWVAPQLSSAGGRPALAPPFALALLGLVIPRWDLGSFSSGFFRVSIAQEYIYRKIHKRNWQSPELVFYEDGMATTVTVDRWDKVYSLKNNGKVDVERRRHADADHRRPVAVPLLQPAAPAQGRAGRLRLGRDRRRDDPVPDRVAGDRRAGGGRPAARASSTTTTTAAAEP